jgi:hypothetical protein
MPETVGTMSEFDPVDDLDETETELWTQMNLVPADTGLPMTVWIRPRSNERHSARIKVCAVHGPRMLPDDTVTVVLHPRRVIPSGGLSADDLRAINAWLALNEAVVRDHWDGLISSSEVLRRLRRI